MKPYNRHLEEALAHGITELPAAPDGIYLKRLHLEDIIDLQPVRRDVFKGTCHTGKKRFKRKRELDKHMIYEILDIKWWCEP
jgi:hypothetical protein